MDSLLPPQVWLDERHSIHLTIQVVLLCHPRKIKQHLHQQQHRCSFFKSPLISL